MRFMVKNLVNFSFGFVLLLLLTVNSRVGAIKINFDGSEIKVVESNSKYIDMDINDIIKFISEQNIDINSVKSINILPGNTLLRARVLCNADGIERFENLESLYVDGLSNAEENIIKLSKCRKLKNLSLEFICTEEVKYHVVINEIFPVPCLIKDNEVMSEILERVLDIDSLKCLRLGSKLRYIPNVPALEKIKNRNIILK